MLKRIIKKLLRKESKYWINNHLNIGGVIVYKRGIDEVIYDYYSELDVPKWDDNFYKNIPSDWRIR